MSEQGHNQPPQPAAMVHLYRGLMDRATAWRTRIDMPTSWSIVISGTVANFVLGDPSRSHAVILLTMLLTSGFWMIEARRYRYYDLWAGWVRLLETDYFAPMLAQNQITVDQYWHQLITSDMVHPHFKITWREALGRRLHSNHLAIMAFLLLVWLLKLWVHPINPEASLGEIIIQDAALGPLPGLAVMAVVVGFYSILVVLAVMTARGSYGRTELLTRDEEILKLTQPLSQPVSGRWRTRKVRGRMRGSIED